MKKTALPSQRGEQGVQKKRKKTVNKRAPFSRTGKNYWPQNREGGGSSATPKGPRRRARKMEANRKREKY